MMQSVRALCVAVALLPVMAIPAAAAAGTDGQVEINDGNGWQHDASAPLFSIDNIFPSWQQARTFEVRNNSGSAADLALESTDIVERENECNHPEAVVDTTCGSDQGELGHELIFTVYTDPQDNGNYGADPVWSGTLYDLGQPVVLADHVAANGTLGVRVVAELPMSSGNETQTDQVGFGLRIDAQRDDTDVLGETVHRHDGGSSGTLAGATLPSSGGLPFTGLDVAAYLAGGLALLAGGALLLATARRRERPHAA